MSAKFVLPNFSPPPVKLFSDLVSYGKKTLSLDRMKDPSRKADIKAKGLLQIQQTNIFEG